MQNVTIYTTPSCGYCKMAKNFFNQHNVTYNEKDVAADVAAREEMVAKTNQMGVPVIDIDGKIIIGFDQPRLHELISV